METFTTRRQALKMLAGSTVLGGIALSGFSLGGLMLSGCGGSGGGSGGGGVKTTTARIPVSLPAGFSLPLAELEGGTAYGSGALDATGFSAKVVQNAPTFAYVRHKPTGKFVLFGMAGTGRPGITPVASAALMLAMAFGITGLPGENVAQALSLLETDPNVAGLGDAIASAMATHPYAVADADPAVVVALKSAYAALSGTAAPTSVAASGSKLGNRGRAEAPLILIDPADAQGGFRIEEGEDGFVVPTNLKRRPALAYTYLVGHETDAGATDVAPARRVDFQEMKSTSTLLGSVASLGVRGAWSPAPGKPIELPISGQDVKTKYATVVLMASGDKGAEPGFFAEGRFSGEVGEWRQKRKELNRAGFLGIVGDIFGALGTGAAELTLAAANAIAAELAVAAAASNYTNFVADLETGNFADVAVWLLKECSGAGFSQARTIAAVEDTLGLAPAGATTVEGLAIAGAATVALATLAVCTAALGLADIAASYYDVVSSPQGERWDETAVKPGVRVSPRKADIRQNQHLTLSASVVGAEGQGAKYTWTLGGSVGATLRDDSSGQAGSAIETNSSTIVVATSASTQGTLTVTVSVKSAEGKDFGSDVATLTVVENKPVTENATFYVHTAQQQGEGNEGRTQVSADVSFAEVPGATRYTIHGEGANDPDYYGTSIDLTYQGPFVDAAGATFPFVVVLAGGNGPADSGFEGYYQNRFGGFHFTATAYFD